MAVKGDIYLGPSAAEVKTSPFGRKLMVSTKETSRDERTANGTLKQDILYVKHTFKLSYSKISGDDLATLEGIYDNYVLNKQPLTLKIFLTATVSKDYTVTMKPTNKTRLLLREDGIWTGVSFELIEI